MDSATNVSKQKNYLLNFKTGAEETLTLFEKDKTLVSSGTYSNTLIQ